MKTQAEDFPFFVRRDSKLRFGREGSSILQLVCKAYRGRFHFGNQEIAHPLEHVSCISMELRLFHLL